jgi:hypothetical protein
MKKRVSKTAAEWLLHLPPKYREAVKTERNKYWQEQNGNWEFEYPSLLEMLWGSENGKFYLKKSDPLWVELYTYVELKKFDYPWKEESNSLTDMVNKPPHYNKGGIECISAIESSLTKEAFLGYLKGNILKYLWRYENKNGLEDLKKAKWYLEKLITLNEEK